MASKSRRYSPHEIYKRKARKLQSKGLLGEVNLSRKNDPRVIRAFEKYRDVLSNKATVVQAPSKAKARALRKQLGVGGRDKAVIVPKESKSEKIVYSKRADAIVSTRKGYREGETIRKTYGEKFKSRPKNAKAYYILRERTRGVGKLKRRIFSTFDEMLYYLAKYDINFEDIEDHIEIEEVEKGGAKDEKLAAKIAADRAAYYRRKKRKKPRRKKRR